MKNWMWILIGIIGLAILLYLASDYEEIPHATIHVDTTEVIIGGGSDGGGSIPEMDYEPKSYKKQPSEKFLGKKFSVCLQMVHEWPDAEIYEIEHPHEGIAKMDFKVNRHNHELSFLDDVCVADYIIK